MIIFLRLFTFGILTSTCFHVVYCCIKLILSVLNKPALISWKACYTFSDPSYSPLKFTAPADFKEMVH